MDTHRPYHHKRAYALMLKVAKDIGIDEINIIGDYADFYWINGHGAKDPRVVTNLMQEVECVNEGLDELDSLFPYAKKRYIQGNHEYRLERYIQNKAPELFGFISCQSLFKIDQRKNWSWVSYGPNQRSRVLGSKLFIRHEPLGNSAKLTAARALCSIVHGHTHRIEESHIVGLDGTNHVAFCGGWLGDKRKDEIYGYVKGHHQWQLGFVLVWVCEKTGYFYHHKVHILDNMTCVVNGKLYKG